jgi:metallo-beta-lactamase class B
MPVNTDGRTYQVVFYCSTTVVDKLVNNTEYPGIVADYERSFTVLRALPCDVFLAPHPSFFHMEEELVRLYAGKRDAFLNPGELRRYVDASAAEFRKELAKQTAPPRGK